MITTGTIFVVEGKTDQALINSFYQAYVVTTDGYNVSHETISHVQALASLHKIVIITDQDKAGDTIRQRLLSAIPTAVSLILLPHYEKHVKKIGLAETKRSVIKTLIAPHLIAPFQSQSDLTWEALLTLCEEQTNKEAWLMNLNKRFSLLRGPLKKTYAQLLLLNVTRAEIERNENA